MKRFLSVCLCTIGIIASCFGQSDNLLAIKKAYHERNRDLGTEGELILSKGINIYFRPIRKAFQAAHQTVKAQHQITRHYEDSPPDSFRGWRSYLSAYKEKNCARAQFLTTFTSFVNEHKAQLDEYRVSHRKVEKRTDQLRKEISILYELQRRLQHENIPNWEYFSKMLQSAGLSKGTASLSSERRYRQYVRRRKGLSYNPETFFEKKLEQMIDACSEEIRVLEKSSSTIQKKLKRKNRSYRYFSALIGTAYENLCANQTIHKLDMERYKNEVQGYHLWLKERGYSSDYIDTDCDL